MSEWMNEHYDSELSHQIITHLTVKVFKFRFHLLDTFESMMLKN